MFFCYGDCVVFVLDRSKKPLMPCSPKRARLLLSRARARVHLMFPFTIRLIDRKATASTLQPLMLKLDPGSKVTGLSINRIDLCAEAKNQTGRQVVISLAEIVHRGKQISAALTARRALRRGRRARKTRYRAPRFLNRGNQHKGWLAPSLWHRVETTLSWVKRFSKLAPISCLSQELVRFDMQKMQNPEIAGVQYQRGTLFEYEVREYLLEKWGRQCAYCDATSLPLEVEHIVPKRKGGTNRVSNLTLACRVCNQKKGVLSLAEFVKDKQRREGIERKCKAPLKDAAAVNSTRQAIFNRLKATGLPVVTGTGGQTKFNRHVHGLVKTHALDAACVGVVSALIYRPQTTLSIKCSGRGGYQRARVDAYGFPVGYCTRQKSIHGFQTGDMVKAIVTKGKKTGQHSGRVAVRATGSFNIQTRSGVVQGVSHKYCKLIQRGSGYGFSINKDSLLLERTGEPRGSALSLPALKGGVSRATR